MKQAQEIVNMKGETFAFLLISVGRRLTELRKEKGYATHEDFAVEYDLPAFQYWRLEKGRANFTLKTLMRVLEIHQLSLEDFFISVKQRNTVGNQS
jgi:hypothetical protein